MNEHDPDLYRCGMCAQLERMERSATTQKNNMRKLSSMDNAKSFEAVVWIIFPLATLCLVTVFGALHAEHDHRISTFHLAVDECIERGMRDL